MTLIYADPSPETLPPRRVTYYAGGTRIAWDGSEFGIYDSEIWSIDANGDDVQRLSHDPRTPTLIAVWDPR